ncbi:MAG TPA: AAA family ATPase [Phycisphaerae bacterium]|nr:AAA family ATPase [Phycisphaerae bacterium]
MTTKMNGTKNGAKTRLADVRKQVKARFVERSPLVDGALTALIARDHLLMLGLPGTAKSDIAEQIARCIASSFFDIQLTKDTAPEEVFGMFSAKKMMEEDRYERRIDGVAPACQVWFLDEIFKSSSALLNGFLLAMQQRKMRNGSEMVDLPLETVMAASNEYPEDSSLDALYDRFAMKFWLDYIGDDDAMLRLMVHGPSPVDAKLEAGDLEDLRAAAEALPWGDEEGRILLAVKKSCADAGFIASDRTWIGKAPKLIRARAILNGHDRVMPGDFLVLADVIWKRHTNRPTLLKTVGNASDPYGARASSIIDGVRIAMAKLPSIDDVKTGVLTKPAASKIMGEIQGELAGRRDAIMEVVEKSPDNDAVKEAVDAVETALALLAKRGKEITLYRPVSL